MKIYESIPPELQSWLEEQCCFYVASAPTVGMHVNVSPKGYVNSAFSVLSPTSAAYIDMTGSGCETISHLYDNGRITVMFNSYGKETRIMRIFCRGTVVEADSPMIPELLKKMGKEHVLGLRSIILLDIFRVMTSCGYGVPIADEAGIRERPMLLEFTQKVEKLGGPTAIPNYQNDHNSYSFDGNPGLRAGRKRRGERPWIAELRYSLKKAFSQWQTALLVFGIGFAFGRSDDYASQLFFVALFLPFFFLIFQRGPPKLETPF